MRSEKEHGIQRNEYFVMLVISQSDVEISIFTASIFLGYLMMFF